MSYLIVGSSAGLGRALAEELARNGHDLVLASSDQRDVAVLGHHLTLTYGVVAKPVACDLVDGSRSAAEILRALGDDRLDGVLMVAGYSRDDDDGSLSGEALSRVIDVNLTSVQELLAALLPLLAGQGSGSIVGFGSIAAVRGRPRNVAYASAKRGLRSYFESLELAMQGTSVYVQFYELGYLATQQTFGRRLLPPPADPARLARRIVSQLRSGSRIDYLPRYWSVLAVVIRLMPAGLFKKLSV